MKARQYRYTVDDVASSAGVDRMQVYRDQRAGKVDLESLPSVVRYVWLKRLEAEE